MKGLTVVLGLLVLLGAVQSLPIKKIVVLMLENRSFDHMVGYLNRLNANIDGPTGKESNPTDVNNPNGPRITISDDAEWIDANPPHSISGTGFQIFSEWPLSSSNRPPASMQGFVEAMAHECGSLSCSTGVMRMFNSSTVPVISKLAMDYAVFDRWYSSVPGPTEVNRAYLHSATSHGMGWNNLTQLTEGLPQKTLYDLLDEKIIDYRFFMGDFSTYLFFQSSRQAPQRDRFSFYEEFASYVNEGKLPTFSFIDPRYFTVLGLPANDQHPDHSVEFGEQLILDTYNTLRNSKYWNETLFIITYDEHGGFYDHVTPPMNGVPNPDGLNSTAKGQQFGFDRLGIRVPTIMISPWISKGTVIHEPNAAMKAKRMPDLDALKAKHHAKKNPAAAAGEKSEKLQAPRVNRRRHNPETPTFVGDSQDQGTRFEHSSLIASLTWLYGLNGPLTKRDAWAENFFPYIFDPARTEPRTDTIDFTKSDKPVTHTPRYYDFSNVHVSGELPVNDLQRNMLMTVDKIMHDEARSKGIDYTRLTDDVIDTLKEHQAGEFIRSAMKKWLGRE